MRPESPPPIGLAPSGAPNVHIPSPPPPAPANDAPQATPPAPAMLIAPDLVVEIDAASARFVSKLIDPETQETTRQYPKEVELAFSRAVRAYVTAKNA